MLNLVRACRAAIDLGMHVAARDRLGLPDERASVFVLLRNAQRIDAELCTLGDFEAFCAAILNS